MEKEKGDGINRDKLRGVLAERHVSQRRLARMTGYHRNTVNDFICGSVPSFGLVRAIVLKLNLSAEVAAEIFLRESE